jgi:hypothetical protein
MFICCTESAQRQPCAWRIKFFFRMYKTTRVLATSLKETNRMRWWYDTCVTQQAQPNNPNVPSPP